APPGPPRPPVMQQPMAPRPMQQPMPQRPMPQQHMAPRPMPMAPRPMPQPMPPRPMPQRKKASQEPAVIVTIVIAAILVVGFMVLLIAAL
ncbi:MAG TPA: hypothetical protein VE172_23125, partial [Stackebrandtia sp.]|uniref:hypothetical protein n=1 Tax=Stackebrandtia sp. TaxID=2023065 RepID=UPI002D3C7DF6